MADLRKFSFSLVFLLCCIAHIGVSHANDFILESAYYKDSSNQLSFDQVKEEHFTDFTGAFTGGYSDGSYWIRLKVKASSEDLILKIRPPYIEQIKLFYPDSSSKNYNLGALYPWASQEIEAYSFNFSLPPSASDRYVYLLIKSNQSYLAYFEVMTLSQYMHSDRVDHMISMGFVMLSLVLAIWLLVTWLINREIVLGIFVIQQFVAFLHTFFKVGFARTFFDSYVSNETIAYLNSLVTVVYPLVGFLANKFLLQEYGLKSMYRVLFNALIVMSTAVILLYAFGYPQALKVNAILVLIAVTYFSIASLFGVSKSLSTFKSDALSINALRIFYIFSLVFWLIAILPLLGFISVGEFAMHSLLVYNISSGMIFFFLLQMRSKALLKQEIAHASNMATIADEERKRREEQTMFMSMLSHEIKTPLSVLKLVVDRKVAGSELEGHANRAVNNINFIINRCLQLEKLDAKEIKLNPSTINVRLFLNQLIDDFSSSERFNVSGDQNLALYVDESLLRVVFSNLIENALKYSPPKSLIEIEFSLEAKDKFPGIRFHINNLIGSMGPPNEEEVFKKFYRSEGAKKISGSGIGLYLAQKISYLLGGEISYISQNNRAIFSLWVPN